jgi:hypothetical protein
VCRVLVALIACGVHVQTLAAQRTEYQGLVGGIFLGGAHYRLDDVDPASHPIGGLTVGYRVRLFDIRNAPVSLTPHFALAFTRFRGIALNSNEIGFSRLDKPGLQLAVGLGRIRPYLLAQHGQVSVERYVGADLMNYYGSTPMYGLGVELPRSNACGAGLDVAVRRTTGRLSQVEWRDPTGSRTAPPGGSIASTIVTIGWSGRLRGTRLLFACR